MWGLLWQRLVPPFQLGGNFDCVLLHGWGMWAVALLCQALPPLSALFVFFLPGLWAFVLSRGHFFSWFGSEGGTLRSQRRPTALGGRVWALDLLPWLLRFVWLQGIYSSMRLSGTICDGPSSGALTLLLLPSVCSDPVTLNGTPFPFGRDQEVCLRECARLEMEISQAGHDEQQVLPLCYLSHSGMSVPAWSLLAWCRGIPAHASSRHASLAIASGDVHSCLFAPSLAFPLLGWSGAESSENDKLVGSHGYLGCCELG